MAWLCAFTGSDTVIPKGLTRYWLIRSGSLRLLKILADDTRSSHARALSPPSAEPGRAATAFGWECGAGIWNNFRKGVDFDPGEDESLQFRVAFGLSRASGAMGPVMRGKNFFTCLMSVHRTFDRLFNRR